MDEGTPRLLVEGRPGIGKTTLARRLVDLLQRAGVPVGGFFTGELQTGGRREGFVVEAVSGDRELLAHVDLPGPPRVGRYGVDLAAFERVALAALGDPGPGGVVVVDELGKMELASAAFRVAVVNPVRAGRGRGVHRPAGPPSVHRCAQASARHPGGSGHRNNPRRPARAAQGLASRHPPRGGA